MPAPLNFRCSKCRHRAAPFYKADRNPYRNDGWLVNLTGRTRDANRRGDAGGGSDIDAREYECLTCGHIGWSRHIDLKRQAKALAS